MSILLPKRSKLAEFRPALAKIERRMFLRQALSFGALSMLTGCDIGSDDDVEKLLWKVSRFNDKVQAFLFDPNKLAPTYPESATSRPRCSVGSRCSTISAMSPRPRATCRSGAICSRVRLGTRFSRARP